MSQDSLESTDSANISDVADSGFAKMGLRPELLKSLSEMSFFIPTPIQEQAIPKILAEKRDLIGFAQTGTGKTAAFGLPILNALDTNNSEVQALVLCPTRELCMQIERDFIAFGKHLQGMKSVAIYGGKSMFLQIRALESGAQIAVGTPGRVLDLVKRGKLKLDRIQTLVLDEADDMLDKGFKEDLDAILESTPKEKQTLLFSATMSNWIREVAAKKMKNPHEIKVTHQNQSADTVEHLFMMVHARDRYAALRRILDSHPEVYGIVFCRTRRDTKEVADKLMQDHYAALAIHGDLSQDERSDAMARFRKGQIRLLVATDVAARGIDVNELTHVINYELPDTQEVYVHRSGRTGRAGHSGISITIIHLKERHRLRQIESMMRKTFKEMSIPSGKEICEAQLIHLIKKIKETAVDEKALAPFMGLIFEELKGLSYEELIRHFVSLEFNRFLDYYSKLPDISPQHAYSSGGSGSGSYQSRTGSSGRTGNSGRGGSSEKAANIRFEKFQISCGRRDGFTPKHLFMLINKNQSLKGVEIGSIKVDDDRTSFEADARYEEKLFKFLGRESHKGRQVQLKKSGQYSGRPKR